MILLTLALLGLQQPAPHGPEPGPRAPLAGLAGFQSVSKLDFGAQQNRLTVVYMFPDRVRWHFENYSAQQRSEHQFFYRHGENVRELASARASREMRGEERSAVILQMELRRAAMLWPDGFEWMGGESGRLTASVLADTCCRELPLGTLEATLEAGKPRRIAALDAAGHELEALEIREWQQSGGRAWPRSLVLDSKRGGFVEMIESIETRVHYLELSFLPPDARPLPGSTGPGQVMARDLVAMTYSVRALEAGSSWEQALDQARHRIEEASSTLKARDITVDPVPMFELSAEGRPLRGLVRLGAPVIPAPDDFVTLDERAGLFLLLQELDGIDAAVLARLSAAVPEGARPGIPYLRVHDRPNLPIELVLPLVPAD